MSIINQVLNELEKRGANVPLGEATIRAVAPRKQSRLPLYTLLLVMLLTLLGVSAKWYLGRTETAAPVQSVVMTAPMSSAAPVTASAPTEVATMSVSGVANVSQPYPGLHGKPLLGMQHEEKPDVVPEVKKTVRHKPKRSTEQVAGKTESLSAENPVDPQLKRISPQQQAENEFSKANRALQEGRINDALAGYEGALSLEPLHHAARQALVGVLLKIKRNGDAETALQDGLTLDPHHASFAMLLARLQVERGAVPLALETLQKTLPYAEDQADYQAFVAALLQRQSRHDEAVAHYQIALKRVPDNGIWLMGLGISLQALHRNDDARSAYQRALASNSLSAQLQGFVQNKLKEL